MRNNQLIKIIIGSIIIFISMVIIESSAGDCEYCSKPVEVFDLYGDGSFVHEVYPVNESGDTCCRKHADVITHWQPLSEPPKNEQWEVVR